MTEAAAQRGLRTMYLYFFQLQAFGSSEALISAWGKQSPGESGETGQSGADFHSFKPTTRFLLHVFDSDGEFG